MVPIDDQSIVFCVDLPIGQSEIASLGCRDILEHALEVGETITDNTFADNLDEHRLELDVRFGLHLVDFLVEIVGEILLLEREPQSFK